MSIKNLSLEELRKIKKDKKQNPNIPLITVFSINEKMKLFLLD